MKLPRWTPVDPATITARRAWAKAMVAHITHRTADPAYGSPRWAALADDDPRKLAAAVIAAECWATDTDDLPDRVRRDLADLHQVDEHHWAERFDHARKIAQAAASPAAFTLRAHYAHTQAERIADARRHRPGDYPGQHLNRSRHINQHTDAVQDGEAA
ncbi:DUF2742 domain-containing protein [Kribbella sp. NPDC048928]|uniref:DUF2742 domain-containing protein n=1 Tax=Kribbella sp. NPDC048928 TaxID=3364111 RepID=UPI003710B3BF